MSMDLTGEDAFDKLLERAISSEVESRSATARANMAEHELQAEKKTNKESRDEVARLKSKLTPTTEAAQKLKELWDAAEAFHAVAGTSPTVDRLQKALAATSEICDPIPF